MLAPVSTCASMRATVRGTRHVAGQQAWSRPQSVVAHSTKKKSRLAFEEEQSTATVGRVVEEASASSHGLFNDNFKAVLADALSRQGTSALLQGQEKINDEYQLSGQEEVLKAAIMASKSTLLKLQMIKSEVEKSIEVETKQVERLLFALEKARSDAAYYRTVANMIDDGPSTD